MDFELLVQRILKSHDYLKGHAVSAVNKSLTLRNWLFGCHIVEYEQNGKDRAKYGDKLFAELASDLKRKGIKGLSKRNLHYCCQFYIVYPGIGQLLLNTELPMTIVQTVSAQSKIIHQEHENLGVDPELLIHKLLFL